MISIVPGANEPRLPALHPARLAWMEQLAARISPQQIEQQVRALPGPRTRREFPQAMQQADDHILNSFRQAGWQADLRPYRLENVEYAFSSGTPNHYDLLEGANIVATLPGEQPAEAVVLIAHHDTVPDTVGANDNTASLVCMLELARLLAGQRFRRTLIFAAVDMEELGLFGSQVLAAEILAHYRLSAAIVYDTMGWIWHEPGTQKMPAGLEYLYPQQMGRVRRSQMRGDFTTVLYNGPAIPLSALFSAALAHLAGRQAPLQLRDPNNLPLIGTLLGRKIPMVRQFARSDHVHFWLAGLPAIMVTDTANFRAPHYHQPSDTPEKLDYTRLAHITAATALTIAEFAGLQGP